jgi:FO synthase
LRIEEPGLSGAAGRPVIEWSRADSLAAGTATGAALEELMARAASVRDRTWGRVVTYSRKVFIPLTNLCRDTCGYCIFAKSPDDSAAKTLSPDEVLAIAEAGRRLGCKEALFSLGERPERKHAASREALARFGYSTTHDYLRAMCALVLDRTGLIPHANPGTMDEAEMRALIPVTGSMGMMLETVSERLMEPGAAHHACPDKRPSRRIATLEAAGRFGVPFTTGILIGIGETWEERIDALEAIAALARRDGAIQEVIVQNFRSKNGIRLESAPEPSLEDMLRTLAVARLMLPPEVSLQAPPNLMPHEYALYIRAGLNDWGGVSPVTLDHINPEAAWPAITELSSATAAEGFKLRERLTVYPRYLARPERHIAPELRERLLGMAGPDGLPLEQRVA